MQVIYAWAKNAPKLVLPEEVAFKIGGQTEVQYLVLQVHYASVESFKGDENYMDSLEYPIILFYLTDGSSDDSGVLVYFTKMPYVDCNFDFWIIVFDVFPSYSGNLRSLAC